MDSWRDTPAIIFVVSMICLALYLNLVTSSASHFQAKTQFLNVRTLPSDLRHFLKEDDKQGKVRLPGLSARPDDAVRNEVLEADFSPFFRHLNCSVCHEMSSRVAVKLRKPCCPLFTLKINKKHMDLLKGVRHEKIESKTKWKQSRRELHDSDGSFNFVLFPSGLFRISSISSPSKALLSKHRLLAEGHREVLLAGELHYRAPSSIHPPSLSVNNASGSFKPPAPALLALEPAFSQFFEGEGMHVELEPTWTGSN